MLHAEQRPGSRYLLRVAPPLPPACYISSQWPGLLLPYSKRFAVLAPRVSRLRRVPALKLPYTGSTRHWHPDGRYTVSHHQAAHFFTVDPTYHTLPTCYHKPSGSITSQKASQPRDDPKYAQTIQSIRGSVGKPTHRFGQVSIKGAVSTNFPPPKKEEYCIYMYTRQNYGNQCHKSCRND